MLELRWGLFRCLVVAGFVLFGAAPMASAADPVTEQATSAAPALPAAPATATGAQATSVRITPRGPVSADQLVSLRRDMTWAEALDAIQRAARQVIVYGGKMESTIGVGVSNRPWREALDILLGANGLELAERQTFWEIVAPAAGEAPRSAFSLGTRQVQISAIFFVADRGYMREIGVDWSTVSGAARDALGSPEAVLLDSIGTRDYTGAVATSRSAGDQPYQVGGASVVDVNGHEVRVRALLSTIESNNHGKVIASPQITVVDGKEGLVEVGREFAITITDFAGNAITRFHSTGVKLTVTPRIITEAGIDFIHLSLVTERSSLIDPVQQIIDKTNASTELLLYDGEETALAGLIQAEQNTTRRGIPLLRDLPAWFLGLRYVFGYDFRQTVDKELVILLQAKMLPTIEERIAAKAGAIQGEALKTKRDEFRDTRKAQLEGSQ